MLVLTRRPKEKIIFPTIHTEVQVLGMHGGQVRLGIEAPPQVSVIREELQDPKKSWGSVDANAVALSGRWSGWREFHHRIRNRLNDVGLSLGVLRYRFQKGDLESIDEILQKIEDDFRFLKDELESGFAEAGPEPLEKADPPLEALSQ